nr:MAG TPA: hypothetical protein [Caudoviricetes sp.]DAP46539.1 MAG TPA: hypothetical protein [Caudoviricetes sp.]DAT65804.1 MAG TPA: hypothetical protein [Caudoviricetes sp.]
MGQSERLRFGSFVFLPWFRRCGFDRFRCGHSVNDNHVVTSCLIVFSMVQL